MSNSPYTLHSDVERMQSGAAWSRQEETRAYRRAVEKKVDEAMDALMSSAAKSQDPAVAKAWAVWASFSGVLESLQRTEKSNGQ